LDQAALDQAEKAKVSKYIKIFWALCIFTVAEVGIVFFEKVLSKLVIDSVVILFTMLKAGFVGYYFMHLEYEKRWTKIVAVLPLLIVGFYAIFLMPDTVRERPISLYVAEPARVYPVHEEAKSETAAAPIEGQFFQVKAGEASSGAPAGAAPVAAPVSAPAAGSAPTSDNPLDSVEAWR